MSDKYRIEYDNNTGPDDEGFDEWWSVVSDEGELCRCGSEENAKIILGALLSPKGTSSGSMSDRECLMCPLCKEEDFDPTGLALHFSDCDVADRLSTVYHNEKRERDAERAKKMDIHKLGTCLRFANGETCVGCGDSENGQPLGSGPLMDPVIETAQSH